MQAGEKNIVKIKLTGVDNLDKKLANRLAGFKRNPKGYTWHHLDDYDPITNTCTMQLVKTRFHEITYPHYGGVEIVKKYFNTTTLYKSRTKFKKIKI